MRKYTRREQLDAQQTSGKARLRAQFRPKRPKRPDPDTVERSQLRWFQSIQEAHARLFVWGNGEQARPRLPRVRRSSTDTENEGLDGPLSE